MKAVLVALAIVVTPFPAAAFDDLPESGTPVGCCDPDALWDLLDAEDNHDVARMTKLMKSHCHSLAGVRYLLEQQRNGVSRVRVFPDQDNWSKSWVTYTLDEMVEPDQVLPIPQVQRVPTGWVLHSGATPPG
jgi:hypothetical protein